MNQPTRQFSLKVAMSACHVCVCVTSRKPPFAVDWRLLIEECIADIEKTSRKFWFFTVSMNIAGPLQSSLLCITGDLTGVGYEAVAVGFNDM